MGKLVAWGALGGAAKGMQENIKTKQAAEQSAIDDARATRLEKLKQQGREAITDIEQTGAGERTEATVAGRQEVQETAGEQKTEQIAQEAGLEATQTDRDNAFEAEQKQLDRASQERIANIRASATGSGKADPRIKAMLDRFESKTLTDTQKTEYGIPMETDTPAIYDNMSGRWYVQEGDKYLLPGTEQASVRRAPRKAVDYLYENPGLADQFLQDYKYLPLGYLSVLRQHDIQQMGPAAGAGTQVPPIPAAE